MINWGESKSTYSAVNGCSAFLISNNARSLTGVAWFKVLSRRGRRREETDRILAGQIIFLERVALDLQSKNDRSTAGEPVPFGETYPICLVARSAMREAYGHEKPQNGAHAPASSLALSSPSRRWCGWYRMTQPLSIWPWKLGAGSGCIKNQIPAMATAAMTPASQIRRLTFAVSMFHEFSSSLRED